MENGDLPGSLGPAVHGGDSRGHRTTPSDLFVATISTTTKTVVAVPTMFNDHGIEWQVSMENGDSPGSLRPAVHGGDSRGHRTMPSDPFVATISTTRRTVVAGPTMYDDHGTSSKQDPILLYFN